MQYVSFCVWLIPLDMMLSRFVHDVAGVRPAFPFRTESYSFGVYTPFIYRHLLIDSWAVPTFW